MLNSKRNFLDIYDELSDEIRFLCNSDVRLKILKTISDDMLSMKEINDLLLLSYSSISSNLIKLVDEGLVIKKDRKFYLSNIGRLILLFCMDFDNSIKVSNVFVDFLKTHDISPLCEDSLRNISSLNGANLIESLSVDIYKPHNEFINHIESANVLKVIFPYLHPDYPVLIKNLLSKDVSVDVLVNQEIISSFVNQLGKDFAKEKIDEGKLSIRYVKDNLKLALAVSDRFISIGLFKSDGNFDYNRLLISEESAAIKWGDFLFDKHYENALVHRRL